MLSMLRPTLCNACKGKVVDFLRPAHSIPLQGKRHARRKGTAPSGYDVAIVGGGVMGSSAALHLAAMSGHSLRIGVFERDSTYAKASAPRSAGGIRQQFSLPVNIELSLYGIQFLKSTLHELCDGLDIDTDVQFKENGYLVLASPGRGEANLRENVSVQHASGATWIKLLEPAELNAKFPWLSTHDIALGAYGEANEGYFDPWAMLQAMRKAAIARGVTYVPHGVSSIKTAPDGTIVSLGLSNGDTVKVGSVVNAAGAYGGVVAQMCGQGVRTLPVVARKRCMWLFHAGAALASDGKTPRAPDDTPLTISPSGVYFRSEGSGGSRFVCGVSPKPEDDPDYHTDEALDHVEHGLFEDIIWPALAERAPAFESLKVEGSWAGFYEYNTIDQNGIVGKHPDVPNMFLACGFSGHGLQQSPGVGRAVSEMLVHGEYKTIDLSSLSFDRHVRGEPLFEQGIY